MRYQSNASSCGPASLRNALLARGINRSEEELEHLTGFTATNGTSGRGLLAAIRLISKEHPEVSPGVVREARADVAFLKLIEALRGGCAIILCVDNDEHWVTAFGLLGSSIHVADPSDPELVQTYRAGDLMARWRGPSKRPYYGVIV